MTNRELPKKKNIFCHQWYWIGPTVEMEVVFLGVRNNFQWAMKMKCWVHRKSFYASKTTFNSLKRAIKKNHHYPAASEADEWLWCAICNIDKLRFRLLFVIINRAGSQFISVVPFTYVFSFLSLSLSFLVWRSWFIQFITLISILIDSTDRTLFNVMPRETSILATFEDSTEFCVLRLLCIFHSIRSIS